MSVQDLPELLTVEEAAVLLRISRTTAYAEVTRFQATGGRAGIPVLRIGSRSLRVPKAALLKMMAGPDLSGEGANDAA